MEVGLDFKPESLQILNCQLFSFATQINFLHPWKTEATPGPCVSRLTLDSLNTSEDVSSLFYSLPVCSSFDGESVKRFSFGNYSVFLHFLNVSIHSRTHIKLVISSFQWIYVVFFLFIGFSFYTVKCKMFYWPTAWFRLKSTLIHT